MRIVFVNSFSTLLEFAIISKLCFSLNALLLCTLIYCNSIVCYYVPLLSQCCAFNIYLYSQTYTNSASTFIYCFSRVTYKLTRFCVGHLKIGKENFMVIQHLLPREVQGQLWKCLLYLIPHSKKKHPDNSFATCDNCLIVHSSYHDDTSIFVIGNVSNEISCHLMFIECQENDRCLCFSLSVIY